MEQSLSYEAEIFSASQNVVRTAWNAKVHYRVQNLPSLVTVLSQRNPIHVLPFYYVLPSFFLRTM